MNTKRRSFERLPVWKLLDLGGDFRSFQNGGGGRLLGLANRGLCLGLGLAVGGITDAQGIAVNANRRSAQAENFCHLRQLGLLQASICLRKLERDGEIRTNEESVRGVGEADGFESRMTEGGAKSSFGKFRNHGSMYSRFCRSATVFGCDVNTYYHRFI